MYREYFMKTMKRIVKKNRKLLSENFFRPQIEKKMRRLLHNKDATIFSCNCTGGVMLHDLGLKFNTPTVNFFFHADDYLKFIMNYEKYINLPVLEVKYHDKSYPVASIGDIKCYLVHYESVEEFKRIWDRRKKRINPDNIYLVWCDRDGFSEEMLELFAKIEYPKVFFSHKPYPEYEFVVYLPEFSSESQVGTITEWSDKYGYKWFDKHFDYVKWLNGQNVKKCLR